MQLKTTNTQWFQLKAGKNKTYRIIYKFEVTVTIKRLLKMKQYEYYEKAPLYIMLHYINQ